MLLELQRHLWQANRNGSLPAGTLYRRDVTVETHLKPSKNLKIQNYFTYRSDRKIRVGGGIAVVVK